MKKFDTLIGLVVKVFLDSHTIDGKLEHLDDEKVILNSHGSYILIYKNKINMVLLNPEDAVEETLDGHQPSGYHVPTDEEVLRETEEAEDSSEEQDEQDDEFIQNGIAENNQYGSILPATLLEQQPMDPVDRLIEAGLFLEDEPTFSINAGTLYNEDGLLDRAERQRIIEETKKEIEDGSTQ